MYYGKISLKFRPNASLLCGLLWLLFTVCLHLQSPFVLSLWPDCSQSWKHWLGLQQLSVTTRSKGVIRVKLYPHMTWIRDENLVPGVNGHPKGKVPMRRPAGVSNEPGNNHFLLLCVDSGSLRDSCVDASGGSGVHRVHSVLLVQCLELCVNCTLSF